jgi:LAO/AO transport system kinase
MRSIAERGAELRERVRASDVVAISQMISALEGRTELGLSLRKDLYTMGGTAHVIGVTGAPGCGKSTLVAALTKVLRQRGLTVGIIAVDPSSSLTGGAILGDRIRMQEHTLDRGAYMRSMSSRGSLGGVSRATVDAVAVLDAAGWDVVIVETVGVGQADVDIVRIAHTTIVVSAPGLGDDIQAIKAGLLEVADLHVVNKADRPDADKAIAELLGMLTLGGGFGDGWDIPVIGTSSVTGQGVQELADQLTAHRAWLRDGGELGRRSRAAAVARIRALAYELLMERLDDPTKGDGFDAVVDAVTERRLDPHTAAADLIDRVAATT